jgi:hypothetical protein
MGEAQIAAMTRLQAQDYTAGAEQLRPSNAVKPRRNASAPLTTTSNTTPTCKVKRRLTASA